MTPEERFDAKWAASPAGCWDWTATLDRCGYGRFWVSGRMVKAHRYAYERWVGPLDPNLTIDHLCRNTRCVNPAHLEEVTRVENVIRMGLREVCRHGHKYDEENTQIRPDGYRVCRACHRAAKKRHREKVKAGRLVPWKGEEE